MKKICFFGCDFQIGGASVVAVNLANELSRNYEVHFVSASDREGTYYGRDSIAEGIVYHNFDIPNARILKMRRDVMPRMKKYILDNDIDVVFAIGYYAAFYIAPILWKRRKCKFVFCEHGAPRNQYSDKKGTLMRGLSVRAYDMTVALTHQSERDFVELIGAKPEKVTTIYNWIDESAITEDAEYRINEKKLLTVGRISEEKGFDMLADIAKDVFLRVPDWEWHIMGDGPDRAKFEQKIREYGIEKNIVMHGSVSGASQYYGEYSAMVLTSYREGLPLVLLEAKAKKLPCVSFDVITGPNEIIRDGVNGYLVEMYDKEKFADRLCHLMKNDEERQKMSDNASLDIEKFKKQTILAEWVSLTERLTSESGDK